MFKRSEECGFVEETPVHFQEAIAFVSAAAHRVVLH